MTDRRISPASADKSDPYAHLRPVEPAAPGAPADGGAPPLPPARGSAPSGGLPSGQGPRPGTGSAPGLIMGQPPGPNVDFLGTPGARSVPLNSANPWAGGAATGWQPPSGPGGPANPYASPPQVPQGFANQAPGGPSFPAEGAGGPVYAPPPQTKNKRSWVSLLVIALVALFVGVYLGQSAAKDDAQKEVDQAWAANSDLQYDLDSANRRIGRLEEQLAGLQTTPENGLGSDTDPFAGFPLGPDPTDPFSYLPEDEYYPDTFPGEGTYYISWNIDPGTYQTEGGAGCSWSLVVDGTGEVETGTLTEPGQVTILSTDLVFITTGCPAWTKVG